MKEVFVISIILCFITGAIFGSISAGKQHSEDLTVMDAKINESQNRDTVLPEEQKKQILTVFEGAMEKDLTGLIVRDSEGNIQNPLKKTDSEELAYGVYYLHPGEYNFSYQIANGAGKEFINIPFELGENTDEALVFFCTPCRVFEVQSKGFNWVNPINKGEVKEDDLPKISIEEKAKALEEFQQIIEEKDKK